MSLILEYCAFGNLKKYLVNHSKEFIRNINSNKEESSIDVVSELSNHTLDLLILWSYQVTFGVL